MLHDWQDQLESLPLNSTKIIIGSFSAALHAVVLCQIEELNLKLKWDDARQHHEQKQQKRELEEWNPKYMQKMAEAADTSDSERKGNTYEQDNATERRIALDNADFKLKAVGAYRKQCNVVREKSLVNLKTQSYVRFLLFMFGNV
ncbi:hypothetical protein ZIOFF_027971 [Zingiber officinale]|uniref:Uncharacterized protein n=1 Tax=Zingiber officinale TaxID=94328 RepID=A0A8J5GRB7_ZINOF|nr:hypothetical protein ZIOFF_027971 [Zingiber officinale]